MGQKWLVEFEVADSWVADGFDLTAEVAKEMLEQRLSYAYGNETSARVVSAPAPDVIRSLQQGGEESHAEAGQYCPTCDTVHCSNDAGHQWNDDDRCVHCGADGRS